MTDVGVWSLNALFNGPNIYTLRAVSSGFIEDVESPPIMSHFVGPELWPTWWWWAVSHSRMMLSVSSP